MRDMRQEILSLKPGEHLTPEQEAWVRDQEFKRHYIQEINAIANELKALQQTAMMESQAMKEAVNNG